MGMFNLGRKDKKRKTPEQEAVEQLVEEVKKMRTGIDEVNEKLDKALDKPCKTCDLADPVK